MKSESMYEIHRHTKDQSIQVHVTNLVRALWHFGGGATKANIDMLSLIFNELRLPLYVLPWSITANNDYPVNKTSIPDQETTSNF